MIRVPIDLSGKYQSREMLLSSQGRRMNTLLPFFSIWATCLGLGTETIIITGREPLHGTLELIISECKRGYLVRSK